MEKYNITPETDVHSLSITDYAVTVPYRFNELSSGTHFCSGCDQCNSYWYPKVIKEYYPIVYWERLTMQPNKFEQAFKIVSKLVEKKRLDLKKVSDFIEVVNEIVEII